MQVLEDEQERALIGQPLDETQHGLHDPTPQLVRGIQGGWVEVDAQCVQPVPHAGQQRRDVMSGPIHRTADPAIRQVSEGSLETLGQGANGSRGGLTRRAPHDRDIGRATDPAYQLVQQGRDTHACDGAQQDPAGPTVSGLLERRAQQHQLTLPSHERHAAKDTCRSAILRDVSERRVLLAHSLSELTGEEGLFASPRRCGPPRTPRSSSTGCDARTAPADHRGSWWPRARPPSDPQLRMTMAGGYGYGHLCEPAD